MIEIETGMPFVLKNFNDKPVLATIEYKRDNKGNSIYKLKFI